MQYDPNENVGTSASDFDGTSAVEPTGADTPTTSGAPGTLRGDTSYGGTQSTGGKAREKASQFKATLADKLEQGAQRIRERTSAHQTQQTASVDTPAASVPGTSTAKVDRTIDRASESLAHGMEKSANWVRNADLDKMKGDVENQVRANPGRALLVAVGLGYLLGKVLRGGRPRI